jgi:HNH endonuclease
LALALEEVCRRAQAVDLDNTKPARTEAVVVIDADQLDPDTPPRLCDAEGVPILGPITRLFCQLDLYPVIIDGLGVPIDMGREIRMANRAQRRALTVRDGGCVFPGCDQPAHWADAHHVKHWTRDRGSTDISNMVLLCRHHHGVVHRKGWNIQIGDDGWAWITTPARTRLWCQQHGQTRTGPLPAAA